MISLRILMRTIIYIYIFMCEYNQPINRSTNHSIIRKQGCAQASSRAAKTCAQARSESAAASEAHHPCARPGLCAAKIVRNQGCAQQRLYTSNM